VSSLICACHWACGNWLVKIVDLGKAAENLPMKNLTLHDKLAKTELI
jgi:hypothetical protein